MSPTGILPEREGEQTVDGTLRLRGGCIPCPVRHFLRYNVPCRPRSRPCMLMDERTSPSRHYHYDCFFGRMRADQSLVNLVGWLNVLHYPYPMLLLIERLTASECHNSRDAPYSVHDFPLLLPCAFAFA